MAYYDYAYPYASALYMPADPWRTTLVPQHFPEHHYPFKKARHAVGNALSTFNHAIGHHVESDAPVIYPRADIQETPKAYYIDIELPGVEDRTLAKLQWISGRTLLVTARNRRLGTGEEKEKEKEQEQEQESKDKAEIDDGDSTSGQINPDGNDNLSLEEKNSRAKETTSKTCVYLTLRERQVGKFARAFSFPTGVDHAQLKAVLGAGVLRIALPKLEDAPVHDKH